jgi:hypothetical protein
MALRDPRLRAFVKLDKYGQVIPGSMVLRYFQPRGGFWYEIPQDVCCTTTTTTSSSTTTTTTT